MARTWPSIRVDLIEGHGEQYWPRPGRIFAAARSHTFQQLAGAIDDALARWDRSHLQESTLADGRRLCDPGLPRARPMLPRAPAQNTQIRTNWRRFRQVQTDIHPGGYSRSSAASAAATAGDPSSRRGWVASGRYWLKKAAARRAISSADTSSMCWLIIHCWPNGSRSRPPRSP